MSPATPHRFARRVTFRTGQTPRNIDQFTTCVNPAAKGGAAADLIMGFIVEIPYGGDGIRTAANKVGGERPEAYSSAPGKASAGGGGGIIAVLSDCARPC